MPVKKRSDETRGLLFEAYEQSGLSAAAFCRERGLPGPYFRTQYRKRCHRGSKQGFAKVQLSIPSAPVTVSVGAVQIRCEASVPSTWLAEVIRQVQA